jgi:hypothetical protein
MSGPTVLVLMDKSSNTHRDVRWWLALPDITRHYEVGFGLQDMFEGRKQQVRVSGHVFVTTVECDDEMSYRRFVVSVDSAVSRKRHSAKPTINI